MRPRSSLVPGALSVLVQRRLAHRSNLAGGPEVCLYNLMYTHRVDPSHHVLYGFPDVCMLNVASTQIVIVARPEVELCLGYHLYITRKPKRRHIFKHQNARTESIA